VWLIAGRGRPFSGQTELSIDKDKEEGTKNVVGYNLGKDKKFPPVRERGDDQEYGPDPYIQATAGLKKIFDLGDPILIKAIQANIDAFQMSVGREQQIQQQANKIASLEEKCNTLEKENEEFKKRLDALEEKHKAGDPHTTASLKESVMSL